MNDLVLIGILSAAAVAIFAWLWRAGYLVRFANYVRETKEELRKCSWPSWDELKGSTFLVAITIVVLGGFTVAVDAVFVNLFTMLKL